MAKSLISWIKGLASPQERGEAILELVRWQVNFGHRYPGSPEHQQFTQALYQYLKARVEHVYEQRFTVMLKGQEVSCVNLIAYLPAAPDTGVNLRQGTQRGPLLLGTHFDTRLIADNEPDPALRDKPILGANDGGSGTAILLHLLDLLQGYTFKRDLLFVFFDAEDIGNIDGHPFSVGARYLASHPLPAKPEEVLVLDMVGGKEMILDIDAHTYLHPKSRRFSGQVYQLAQAIGYTPLLQDKEHKIKYIICDHIPFLEKGIASCVLIDIDYLPWHTQGDLPEALSIESLAGTEDLVLALLVDTVSE
jgi:hypothetical protein